jgi:hypothetical protein
LRHKDEKKTMERLNELPPPPFTDLMNKEN